MLPAKLTGSAQNATAYAAMDGKTLLIAVVNKSDAPLALHVQGTQKPTDHWTLTAPSLDAKTDVRFAAASDGAPWNVPAHSAALWKMPAR